LAMQFISHEKIGCRTSCLTIAPGAKLRK
jgi:hypothetical protein